MTPRTTKIICWWLLLAGLALCQAPPSSAVKNPAVYLLLKTSAQESGKTRESFLLRMMALGVSDMKFVETGATVAVRCSAPASTIAALGTDADIAAVLPIESEAPALVAQPAFSPVPSPVPLNSTPPFIAPPPSLSPGIGIGGAGGMNQGLALLTDMAGGMVVKLLTPAPGCKVGFTARPAPIPPLGGSGALEVKASGNCAWQAVATADWVKINASVLGPGAATVTFTVLPHAPGKRQAAVILQAVGGTGPLRGKTVAMVTQE